MGLAIRFCDKMYSQAIKEQTHNRSEMKSLPENFIQASTLQDPSLRELQILEGQEMDWKSTNWVSYLCSACGFCAKNIAYIYHPSEAATVHILCQKVAYDAQRAIVYPCLRMNYAAAMWKVSRLVGWARCSWELFPAFCRNNIALYSLYIHLVCCFLVGVGS